MQPELQTLLSRPVIQHGVHKGHDGCLQAQVVSVGPRASVQLVHDALEACSFACVLLVMDHCFQYLCLQRGFRWWNKFLLLVEVLRS